jgi:pyruvate/2-oxoglutarate dehydrogenase complex dihydrolipoamide acyltransferase (E2) component
MKPLRPMFVLLTLFGAETMTAETMEERLQQFNVTLQQTAIDPPSEPSQAKILVQEGQQVKVGEALYRVADSNESPITQSRWDGTVTRVFNAGAHQQQPVMLLQVANPANPDSLEVDNQFGETSPETKVREQLRLQPASQLVAGDESFLHKSPLVGTVFLQDSETNPHVSVGDQVKKGDMLAIIEVAKMFHTIEAEIDGVISDILVENGDSVEVDQPLFIIRPLDSQQGMSSQTGKSITVPDLGKNIKEASVVEWKKKPGDPVEKGDVLVELHTSKTVLELPADSAGYLTSIDVEAGETATVGQAIATISTVRDTTDKFRSGAMEKDSNETEWSNFDGLYHNMDDGPLWIKVTDDRARIGLLPEYHDQAAEYILHTQLKPGSEVARGDTFNLETTKVTKEHLMPLSGTITNVNDKFTYSDESENNWLYDLELTNKNEIDFLDKIE